MLGKREPEVYGRMTLAEINQNLVDLGHQLGLEVVVKQSNSEGSLIDLLHEAHPWAKAVVFNPGGYTHSSVALRDAILAIGLPVIEVHLTNVYARESFRQHSLISPVCVGTIAGLGWRSYEMALRYLAETMKPE
jgi:3-dehydroquinate dehydratase-2